jgi:acid phosphatase type 7
MRAWGGKSIAALAAALLLVVGGVLIALRPWAGDRDPAGPRGPVDTPAAPAETPPPSADPPPGSVSILAAADIGRCDSEHDEATAELVEQFPDATVLIPGDLAYEDGSAEDFERCYDPTWGAFKERTRPAPGNHEYETDDADPYFDYFGRSVGEPGKGWYSFDLGDWHLVALNSNCDDVGCGADSEQVEWLRADLEASEARCTLAFWHAPRFTSGEKHGGTADVQALWQVLLDRDVELVLSGHEHFYERTAPLDARGRVDEENGVRQFVVGTGGGHFYELGDRIPGSEAAVEDTAGVLRMTLHPDGYDWAFLPVPANGDSDAGSAECR